MPIRVRYHVDVAISSNPSEQNDLGNVHVDQLTDTQFEGGSWKTTLANGATDVLLNMGNLASANFVVLRTNVKDPTQGPPGNIVITKNSPSGEPWTIAPLGNCLEGNFLTSTTGITAIYASNPGSVIMEVTLMAAGA